MSSVNSSEGVRSRARTPRTRVSSPSASWASTTLPRRPSRSSKRRRLRGLAPANPSVPEQATELVTEQHRYLYRRSECFRIMAVPSPAPTGPPIPYWPSVVVKPDTVRGIQTYYVTLILDIIFGVFALIVGLSSILYVPLLITIFWTAGVTSKGQMYRFMLRSLQPPETRRWSDLASILIPVLGVIGIGVVGSVTARILQLLSDPSAATDPGESSRLFSFLVGGVFLPPGFALVGYVVFFWIVGKTKDRVSAGLAHLYAAVPAPSAWGYPMPPPGAAPLAVAPPPATPPSLDATVLPAAKTAACTRCGFSSPSTAAFCANCGATLSS